MLTQEQQIFEQIKKANNILITFKKTWSGDALSSALGMLLFLKKINKPAEIVAEKFAFDKLYSFLPGFQEIKNSFDNLRKFIISLDVSKTKVSQIKYKMEDNKLNFIISPKDGFFNQEDVACNSGEFKYDLVIIFDTPDLESVGKIYDDNNEFFYQTPIINIDHQSNNEEFGQINFIELTAVSSSEILFSLFESYSRELIDEDIATCLLAGMIAETKSFKTANVTPHALLTASQLISIGARREEIVNQLYRSRSLNILKLWGRVLARLSSAMEDKFIWSTVSWLDFAKTNSIANDLNDVIDELIINIPQAKIIAIIYESALNNPPPNSDAAVAPKTMTNILLHSVKNIDAFSLLADFNPTGSRNLAQAAINKPLAETEKEIVALIQEKLSKLPL